MNKWLIISIAIALLLLIYLIFSGLFYKIVIIEKEIEPFYVAYTKNTGNYKYSGQFMDEIFYKLKQNDIETEKGFGMYFDNPAETKVNERRYYAGVVITENQYQQMLNHDYGVETSLIEPGNSLYTEFIYRNRLSVFISIFKVYPALGRFVRQNKNEGLNSPVIEIYDVPNKKIYFIYSLENSPEF